MGLRPHGGDKELLAVEVDVEVEAETTATAIYLQNDDGRITLLLCFHDEVIIRAIFSWRVSRYPRQYILHVQLSFSPSGQRSREVVLMMNVYYTGEKTFLPHLSQSRESRCQGINISRERVRII